jgi:hypothetical protein
MALPGRKSSKPKVEPDRFNFEVPQNPEPQKTSMSSHCDDDDDDDDSDSDATQPMSEEENNRSIEFAPQLTQGTCAEEPIELSSDEEEPSVAKDPTTTTTTNKSGTKKARSSSFPADSDSHNQTQGNKKPPPCTSKNGQKRKSSQMTFSYSSDSDDNALFSNPFPRPPPKAARKETSGRNKTLDSEQKGPSVSVASSNRSDIQALKKRKIGAEGALSTAVTALLQPEENASERAQDTNKKSLLTLLKSQSQRSKQASSMLDKQQDMKPTAVAENPIADFIDNSTNDVDRFEIEKKKLEKDTSEILQRNALWKQYHEMKEKGDPDSVILRLYPYPMMKEIVNVYRNETSKRRSR